MSIAAHPPAQRRSGVQRLLRAELAKDALGLAWLGQAGFALRWRHHCWLIDPYLSDHLAWKYRGTEFSHERLMPAPIDPSELVGIDGIFCTHRHSDHMDPGSLPALARNNPACRFVVPRAETAAALIAGIPAGRMRGLNAGEWFGFSDDSTIYAIAAAHETFEVNEHGEHHFLGYIFKTPHWTVYHSGDCVPYDGLADELLQHCIDIALLPVNGRDSYRTSKGIAGNMSVAEAKELCRAARIPFLVPHHFGMFAFNTPDPVRLREECSAPFTGRIILPTTHNCFEFDAANPRCKRVSEL